MKICILSPRDKDISSNSAEFVSNLSRYLPAAELSLEYIKKDSAYSKICRLIANKPADLFFNFCDGSAYSRRPGIEVVRLLESKHVAFTGASSSFFDPSRLSMKMAAHSVGVGVPRFSWIESNNYNLKEILETLAFPMIVKPPQGENSAGIFKSSLVKDVSALQDRITKTLSRYGAALIEEFIIGQEFTVLILENSKGPDPIVFKPLECVLRGPRDFKYYDLKWKNHSLIQWAPCKDSDLENKLISAVKKVFLALEGNSFARADFRVDREGNIYLLEMNPNCSVYGWSEDSYGSADYILNFENAHPFFTDTLIQLAFNRKQKNDKKAKLVFDEKRGFCLAALHDIPQGENIIDCTNYGEMSDYRLVTRDFVGLHWNSTAKDFFQAYCWPLQEDVFVMWSRNQDEWLPINHSCNPTTWMEGLKLVARRNIKADEFITIDYLTFCSKDMKEFSCQCGENNCRGRIQGYKPSMKAFIKKTYGQHLSPYIASLLGNREDSNDI